MEKMSPETFRERFGENTAIAALAVQLLLEAMDRKERPFSIVGDIKKAHRRFKHLAKEQGFLACQLDA